MTKLKRILFVDDEPRILDGLRRQLRNMRTEWDMAFANGGAEAQATLATRSFDVLVTDMRMPGIDGAALLTHVQEHYPHMIRVVLSGHTELEAALRAIPVAHQFLSKPCDTEVLRTAIQRSYSIQTVLTCDRARQAASRVKSLPVLPHVYRQVVTALQDPSVGLPEVAVIVETDPAICATLLQVVNSGFFGANRKVVQIKEAVAFLGLAMLRDLTLSAGVFNQLEGRPGLDLQAFQRHALATARLARTVCLDPKRAHEAFTAGMLHDIGHVVVDHAITSAVDHARAGGYLLGLWGLPFSLVEAVAYHQNPSQLPGSDFGIVGAVHVADFLLQEIGGPLSLKGEDRQLDESWLATVGVADRVPGWRELAQRLAEA